MCNFKIGQKVIYITGIHLPKNSSHIIRDIYIRSCGCVVVDVGIVNKELEFAISLFGGYKSTCDNHPDVGIIRKNPIRWFKSTSFRPVQYDNISSELANKFKEVIEVCDHPVKELENA